MKKTSMNVVNPNAAGIDVGSKSHMVAIGQESGDVREFGVYTEDHQDLIRWLRENNIRTIAMESTGSYWQTLFTALQESDFEVILINGKFAKNVKGRKTDCQDCQWIQKLHSLGLVTGSFLPSDELAKLRQYCRHRSGLLEQSAALISKMQKSLRLMNVRLDIALRDIMGETGRKIIESIIAGERDPDRLVSLVNNRVKKSKEEIKKALIGNWREEYLYELEDSYILFGVYESRIRACDEQIKKTLEKLATQHVEPRSKIIKNRSRNDPQFNLQGLSYNYTGVNLFGIEGVSYATVLGFIGEVGMDIDKFPTAKAFVNWLRLAPNNKISGGKVLSSRTPKGKNRLALILRNAANTIAQRKDGALKAFFSRIAYKKGRAAAITATARKLAVIIYNMIRKKQEYNPIEERIYHDKVRKVQLSIIKKKIHLFKIDPSELGVLSC